MASTVHQYFESVVRGVRRERGGGGAHGGAVQPFIVNPSANFAFDFNQSANFAFDFNQSANFAFDFNQ
jgi:hypothetical protein